MALTNSLLLWPIRFDAATYILRVTSGANTDDLVFPHVGSLTVGRNYWLSGDSQIDADGGVGGNGDLVAMLQGCLNTNTGGLTYAVTVSDPSRNVLAVTKTAGVGNFSILWSHINTTLDESIFGFTNAATASGTSAVAPNQTRGVWAPEKHVARDSRDRQPIVGGVVAAISGASRGSQIAVPKKEREVSWALLPPGKALTEYALATEPTGAFEYAWVNGLAMGRSCRLYLDASSRTSVSYGLYRTRDLEDPLERSEQHITKWSVALGLRRAD